MTDKKMITNYVKIMKKIQKTGERLFIQCDGKDTVYLTNSHLIFGIPYSIYVENYKACKCPAIEDAVEIKHGSINFKKTIEALMNDNNSTEVRFTNMCFIQNTAQGERIARVYRYGNKNYGVVNKYYSDLIDLLPTALGGYNPVTVDGDKYIGIGYFNEVVNNGYIILPINFNVEQTLMVMGFNKVN